MAGTMDVATNPPTPSPGQLRWLEAEVGMFVHFGVNTYANVEWSDGTLSPALFNPKGLDCDQWVRVARSFGANYMVLTAKHHDGFCLWPTETTDYSVRSSPWRGGSGDVVGEFVEACKRDGMEVGFYLSPWDRHEPCYADEDAYDEFYAKQLTELCTWYDVDLFELWFDGAGSAGRQYDWGRIMRVCREHQPRAMIFNMGRPTIRWIGNEWGIAPKDNWNAFQLELSDGGVDGEFVDGVGEGNGAGFVLKGANETGNYFLPGECDVPLRNGWFYNDEPGSWYKDPEMLFDIYRKSVGRGANLLLNIAPNRDGRIQDLEVDIAARFGKLVRERLGNPLAEWNASGDGGAGREGDGAAGVVTLPLGGAKMVDCVVIREDLRAGQCVREWVVECEGTSGTWDQVCSGTSIGHKRIKTFEPTVARKVRLRVTRSLAPPRLSHFSAHRARGGE
ncbi:MAG: alpha-L-fucosidase [Promethearchaeota archaeon]